MVNIVNPFMVENTAQGVYYASVPSQNTIDVITVATGAITKSIPIGSNPQGVALSADGSTLYVALSGANAIATVNTVTQTAGSSIALNPGTNPTRVQVGNGNRLWVASNVGIQQIDATTGASTGPDLSSVSMMFPLVSSTGEMQISTDQNSLYFQTTGISPSYAYKYDVSTTTPVEDWDISPGSNGYDVQVSADGNKVVVPNAGNPVVVYQTSNHATLGTLGSGAAFAFSPDGNTGYVSVRFASVVDVYNLTTFTQIGTIPLQADADRLYLDSTGQYLYAAENSQTELLSTALPVAPAVTTQPQTQSIPAGGSATFNASASGTPAPTVQWQISTNGGSSYTNITGANSGSYIIPSVAAAQNGNLFRAVFTNSQGSATSNAATLNVINAPSLAFAQNPPDVLVNATLPSVVVNVLTSSGTINTSDTSLVTLSLATGPIGATLGGTLAVHAVAGVATFSNLTVSATGSYALLASDTSVTSTASRSSNFTARGVLKFLQQPSNTLTSTAVTPAVEVETLDANGAVIISDTSSVTLSIASGQASTLLQGTLTVANVNGVAFFSNVELVAAGQYTLSATDNLAQSVTSNSFQISGATVGTSTTLATSKNPALITDTITLTATVAASSGTTVPTGTVQFLDGGYTLGSATLASGVATLQVTGLNVGSQPLTATYQGGLGFSTSSSNTINQSITLTNQAPNILLVPSINLAGQALTLVPGAQGSINVIITNNGIQTASGTVDLGLVASADGVAADGTALTITPTSTSIHLTAGQSKKLLVNYTVPASLATGSYSLLATIAAGKGFVSSDLSPQSTPGQSPATVSYSFGTVSGRHNVKLVMTQIDGTVNVYRLTGPGEGTLSIVGSANPTLAFTGTTAGTVINISTKDPLTLGLVTSGASIGTFNAPTTTLGGVMNVNGSVQRLVVLSLSNANIAASGFGSVIIEGASTASRLLAGAYFGADNLVGTSDDTYAAGKIVSLRVVGSVTSSLFAAGLNPVDSTFLNGNDVLIAGSRISTISISGTLSSDSRVLASALPRTALVSGLAVKTAADSRFTF